MDAARNTVIIQDTYAKFGSGDIEGLLNLVTDKVVWETPVVQNSPLGGKRTGRQAVADFFSLMPTVENMTIFEPKEFIAQGDKVVVLGSFTATVVETGREYSSDWVHIFTLSGGKITGFLEFFDNAAADRAFQKAESA